MNTSRTPSTVFLRLSPLCDTCEGLAGEFSVSAKVSMVRSGSAQIESKISSGLSVQVICERVGICESCNTVTMRPISEQGRDRKPERWCRHKTTALSPTVSSSGAVMSTSADTTAPTCTSKRARPRVGLGRDNGINAQTCRQGEGGSGVESFGRRRRSSRLKPSWHGTGS